MIPKPDAMGRITSGRNSRDRAQIATRDRFVGCLLGGAVGDALGAPIEFLSLAQIQKRFGAAGLNHYALAYGGLGRITDDTQMTLFTAEGLLRAWVRACLKGIGPIETSITSHAYLRWLRTQHERPAFPGFSKKNEDGWLFAYKALHHRRAPGATCTSSLRQMKEFGARAINDSKGCGGVMRVAPAGLYASRCQLSDHDTFSLGVELAYLTHGHRSGVLPAGAFAVMIRKVVEGHSLPEALAVAKALLRKESEHQETLFALERAQELAASDARCDAAITRLGRGWVAEEALAIALYCVLVAKDFQDGVLAAINHDGDSDSTGSLAGNMLGAIHGATAIPQQWLEPLELRDVIAEIAADLYQFPEWNCDDDEKLWMKYPGW